MRHHGRIAAGAALAVITFFGGASPSSASHGAVSRTSLPAQAAEANDDSINSLVSADGQHVAFDSTASNLVAGDTNAARDVFVRDLGNRSTVLMSRSTGGTIGNGASGGGRPVAALQDGPRRPPAISADGRVVAFESLSSNLVPGDTNGSRDIFVHDRDADQDGVYDEDGGVSTSRVSVSSAGAQANGESLYPAISANGRHIGFTSSASNLVAGDSNGFRDVFVHDLATHMTNRVSLSTTGGQGNAHSVWASLSDNARHVAFYSSATTFVGSDLNGADDVFLRDRDTDGDGVFDESGAVLTRHVSVGTTGAKGNSYSYYGSVSGDGRLVAFESWATNLVPGDTNARYDIYVRDVQAATTTRVSVTSSGAQATGHSSRPWISGDGGAVVFDSSATDLVDGDGNGQYDVFRHDLESGETAFVSLSTTGGQGNGPSTWPSISGNGSVVAFDSLASNLVASDTNAKWDAFVTVRCPSGASEEGTLSGPIHHTVEAAAPVAAAPVVHSVNCDVVVPAGL